MDQYIECFKALSDETRLRIMWVLNMAKTGLCVCEIMDCINETHYNVSRHLKILKNAGLVYERKDGRWVNYCLTKVSGRFERCIRKILNAIPGSLFSDEERKLKERLSLRKDGKCVVGIRYSDFKKRNL